MGAKNRVPPQPAWRQPPPWRTKMPLILALTAAACSADSAYDQLAQRPHCQATGPHRKYVVSELRLPSLQDRMAEDFDGDGKSENTLGGILADARTEFLDDKPYERGIIELINEQLAAGRGEILLDVQASEERPGCAEIALYNAAPARDSQGRHQIALGSETTALRAHGTQQEVQSIAYSRLTAEDARTFDLYLPLTATAHHLRLHGVRVTVTRAKDGWIEGTLHGVLLARDLEQNLWPIWAREQTASVHRLANARGGQLDEAAQRGLASRENEQHEVSRKKCEVSKDCCKKSPLTCFLLPEEVRQYYTGRASLPRPDLKLFDAQGEWRPSPGAGPEQRDSYSLGIGFRARPADFDFACPQGTFCRQLISSQDQVQAPILAGWAGSSSDLWVLTDGCHAWHYDGLAWTDDQVGKCSSGDHKLVGAIWGARGDEVWAALTPGVGFLRWDGGHWRNNAQLDSSHKVIWSIQGTAADDIWAIGATDKSIDAAALLFRYQGQSADAAWYEFWPAMGNLIALLSLKPEVAYAAGYGGNLYSFGDNIWARVNMAAVLAVNLLALAGNSPDNIWAFSGGSKVAAGSCIHYDGKSWARPPEPFCVAPDSGYVSAWMDEKGILWAGGEHGLLRVYDPARDERFRDVQHEGGREARIEKIFGVRGEAARWAVTSDGKLLRYQP